MGTCQLNSLSCVLLFVCVYSFAGIYTETLNDAKIATNLQPYSSKAFVQGK